MIIDNHKLITLIRQLLEWEALEMCENKPNNQTNQSAEKEIYIPYLMNDAVECYLRFEDASVMGPLDKTRGWDDEPAEAVPETIALMDAFEEKIYREEILQDNIRLVPRQDHYGIIIHQQSGNVVSLWYRKASLEVNCYQYHLIGHQWRKTPGEEYIRRLVNLICVLHDKRTYLGDIYCSDIESLLSDLAEFPPVLSYTPINESILGWYPESLDGVRAAKYIAERCEDTELYELFLSYENVLAGGNIFTREKQKVKVMEKVTDALGEAVHFPFWQMICSMMEIASLEYERRDYGEARNGLVKEKQKAMEDAYRARGFSGGFPYMTHPETGEEVYFFEEQPFTVLEEEGYDYKVFALEGGK